MKTCRKTDPGPTGLVPVMRRRHRSEDAESMDSELETEERTVTFFARPRSEADESNESVRDTVFDIDDGHEDGNPERGPPGRLGSLSELFAGSPTGTPAREDSGGSQGSERRGAGAISMRRMSSLAAQQVGLATEKVASTRTVDALHFRILVWLGLLLVLSCVGAVVLLFALVRNHDAAVAAALQGAACSGVGSLAERRAALAYWASEPLGIRLAPALAATLQRGASSDSPLQLHEACSVAAALLPAPQRLRWAPLRGVCVRYEAQWVQF